MITQRFDLNLIPDSSPVVVHCDQYDTGTSRLVISLYEGSVAYSPSGTATIQGSKPDGKGFSYDASLSGNVVTADLKEQMSIVAGRVRCQVVVTESTGRTGTFVFILDVQPSALPSDEDMSESEYQFIEHAIEVTGQAVIDAEAHAEDAEAWAVGERDGVPVTSGDPTYNNNSYYWAQYAAQHAQGGYHYQGAITFANLPTTGMSDGDIYNITDDFVTDNRFIEGAGIQCFAGQNVAWESNSSKWDLWAVFKAGALDDLTDVDITSPTDGQYLGYNAQTQKFENKTLPTPADMTSSTKGIGKPDGKTTEVSSGTFNAIGVSIPAEVNSGGTQYGSNWLYYEGTTEVITPSTKQNYRVIESGTAKLYYWTGSAYAVLSGGGGGGGMNTDGSNADATVGMTSTKVFTIGDRTGKSATGTKAIELGDGANATGYGAVAQGAKFYAEYTFSTQIEANQTTEVLERTTSLIYYPYQVYSFSTLDPENILVTIDGTFSEDITFTSGDLTGRLTLDGTNIKVYCTNTGNTDGILSIGYSTRQNLASGDYSHVEGVMNYASGKYSHAEGFATNAGGIESHAEGNHTTTVYEGAHAEGRYTTAQGSFSHAEGYYAKTVGNYSHAEGYYTRADSQYQHAEGKYNVKDASNVYAWIVGNGTADNARSNAAALDWEGNLELAGAVKSKNKVVTTYQVAITGWTQDTTSQSGTTLYKKQISLNHVYVESPTVDIGSSGVLPTVAEQESYNLLQYVTCDDSVPCLYLYASAIPTTAFYINVTGVD